MTTTSDARPLCGRGFTIVGGGIVGLSLARCLARRGGDVLVIDAGLAGAATPAAAGVLSEPQTRRSLLGRLGFGAREGYERFVREVEEESGIRTEFTRCGFADLARTPDEESALRMELVSRLAAGVEARWLEREELRDLNPGVSAEVRGALFLPRTAWVNPQLLLGALRSSAERLGVRLLRGTASLVRSGSPGAGWEVLVAGPLEECREGRIGGREVVVAAGAWTGCVLEASGLAPPAPIRPIRGQMLEMEAPSPGRTILHHGDTYVVPRVAGTVWVGATVEDAGFDAQITRQGVAALAEKARVVMPGLGKELRAWAGLRPKLLRRGGPLVGEGDPPVIAGHYKSGIHLGPITAHIHAARLAGDPEPVLDPFRLSAES